MIFYLDEALKAYFNQQQPLFDQIMALKGEVFRSLEGRKTERVFIDGKSYFLKQHRGIGYIEIFKNLLQGKLPVISAKNEWQAIAGLQKWGVRAPTVLGYGERGFNPAYKESFVLLEDITNSSSLEEITANWKTRKPTLRFKRALIKEVANMARLMHDHGMNHRDFYLCHFLKTESRADLCLIDLHRAQIRRKTPERWRIKDLAGLYFSSKEIGLTKHDTYRFISSYRAKTVKEVLRHEALFWQKVKERGEKLYRDEARK